MAEVFSKHKNVTVKYNAVDDATYSAAFGKELTQMFKFKRLNNDEFNGMRDLEKCKKLADLTSFDKWVQENADKIVLSE